MDPSDDLLRGAFECAAIGIALIGDDGRILRANAALARLVDRPLASLVGTRFLDLAFEPDRADLADALTRALTGDDDHAPHGHHAVERRVIDAQGAPIWACVTISLVRRGDGRAGYLVAQVEDVRVRKRAEERLERYRLLAERARDIILFIDLDGRIVEANDAAVSAYGYTREELLAKRISDLRATETRVLVGTQMERANASGLLFETVHRRKDGSVFPVQVSSQGAPFEGARVLLSIIRDVTERRRLQESLPNADRLVALGMLTASVAHEINNPLAYVLTNLDLALEEAERLARRGDATGEAMRGELLQAREGALRIRSIVQNTRVLLRTDREPARPVDVRAVLEATVQMAWHEIRARARLVRQYEEVPAVEAIESQLVQVFLNLLVNAVQSIAPGAADRNEIRLVVRPSPSSDGVVVEVRDTGSGIPPAVLDRIFDPFFTTKPAGVGTGLGLSISQSIVASLGGEIAVESTVGHGSVFRVTLPGRVALASAPAPKPTPVTEPLDSEVRISEPGRRPRVFVVDDEPALCTTIRHALEDDYDVVTATDARAALDRLRADQDFDVIVAGVWIPSLSAAELVAALRRDAPALVDRVVFLSSGEPPPIHGARVLYKPFHLDELQRAIDETRTGAPRRFPATRGA